MKTLLIPTDFNVAALQVIPQLAAQYPNHKLNIIMVHLMSITDSERELMMLSRRSAEYRHISDEFYATCHNYRQAYAAVYDIRIEFFYGNTVAAFKNFLEAHDVDEIVMLSGIDYQLLSPNSIDPELLVNRSGITPVWYDMEEQQHTKPVPETEEVYN